MDSQDSFNWQQTSPNIYSRPLDEAELYYATNVKTWEGSGRTASAITAHIGISIKTPSTTDLATLLSQVETSFRYAWKQIRYQCPLLASAVRQNSETGKLERCYQVADQGVLDEWMGRTFSFISSGQTSLEFMNKDPPVPFAALFLFPNKRENDKMRMKFDLVFRCQHDVLDGLATYAVLDNVVRYAAHTFHTHPADLCVPFGDEHKKLTPPLRAALGLPSPTERIFTDSELNAMQTGRTKDRASALAIPFIADAQLPGSTHSIAVSFSFDQTKALLAACKREHMTATQAIHGSIALAVRDLQPKQALASQGKYVSYALVNLRKSCVAPYNEPEYAMMTCHANSTSSLVVHMTIPSKNERATVQSPDEYKKVVEQVQTFYKTKAMPATLLDAPLCFQARTASYPTGTPLVPPPASNPGVALSSMGIVDNYVQSQYGPFEVHDPWCFTTEFSPGIGVMLTTWKGQMHLRAAYNSVFQKGETVRTFLESVKKIAMEGLDIV